jgi:glutamate formiminotransferase
VLVAARPPLIAFNIDLDTDDVELAKDIAAEIRESAATGLPGVRAIGLHLPDRKCAQVSTNVHDYRRTPLTEVVERVGRRAPIAQLELVGLAPRAALEGLPDARFRTIEDALGSEAANGTDEEEAPA